MVLGSGMFTAIMMEKCGFMQDGVGLELEYTAPGTCQQNLPPS